DLGDVASATGKVFAAVLAPGATDRLALRATAEELASTATGKLFVRVTFRSAAGSAFVPALPQIQGLTPLAARLMGSRAVAVFQLDNTEPYLLNVTGTAGVYELLVDVAGDLNGDGKVDGTDSDRLDAVFGKCEGDAGFDFAADLDGSGRIDVQDRLIL